MRATTTLRLIPVILLLGGSIGGCTTDPTTTDEYGALEGELRAVTAERDALAGEVSDLEEALAGVDAAAVLDEGLAATDEVIEFLDAYHEAFEAYDVEAVLGMYHSDGQWISDTPPGRDVYTPEDGPFNAMAYRNPIGGFVRWIGTIGFGFDSRGEPQMITNEGGDIYVSYPSSWHFTYLGREWHITAFTVMWLVRTDDGLAVMRHWNLTPQTVMSP
ncbi:MAG: hypothetical protein KQH83_08280 [Actinobacteria bacterium]|nr:hypothetical protein [Actinomycetota bacterium]